MVHKIDAPSRGSSLIKRILSFCGVLVVFFFCLSPAAPALAYVSDDTPTTYVPFPFEASVYNATDGWVSFPMLHAYNDRMTSDDFVTTFNGISVDFSPYLVTQTGLGYSVTIDRNITNLALNWRGLYVNDGSFDDEGFHDYFGFFFDDAVKVEVRANGYYQLVDHSIEIGDDNLPYPGITKFSWEPKSVVSVSNVEEGTSWQFDASAFDVYGDVEDATGVYIITSISVLVTIPEAVDGRTQFNFATTAHDTYSSNAGNLVEWTTFEGWPQQPDYAPIEQVDFTDWIVAATTGFLSFQIIPGISLSAILWSIIGVGFLVMVLKYFAGG